MSNHKNGLTILHFASQNGMDNIVEQLCVYMPDMNIRDYV